MKHLIIFLAFVMIITTCFQYVNAASYSVQIDQLQQQVQQLRVDMQEALELLNIIMQTTNECYNSFHKFK